MPYASKGQISTAPIQGGIEITQEQYQQGLQGMLSGQIVSIEGGFNLQPKPVEVPPETPTVDPNVPPQVVSRAQGKAALIQAGLWSQVQAYVSAITDPTQKALADVALNDTTEWRRDSPFLTTAATTLGLTAADLDNLFVTAAGIVL